MVVGVYLIRVISGGQTGTDQAGLETARRLGILTGGMMPRGFRTETGARSEFAQLYRMEEHSSAEYLPRTEANLLAADATAIFGDTTRGDSRLTAQLCRGHGKPWLALSVELPVNDAANRLAAWLASHQVRILNVAGSRDSAPSGVGVFTATLLELAVQRDGPVSRQ